MSDFRTFKRISFAVPKIDDFRTLNSRSGVSKARFIESQKSLTQVPSEWPRNAGTALVSVMAMLRQAISPQGLSQCCINLVGRLDCGLISRNLTVSAPK